jgi:hypothetical protein
MPGFDFLKSLAEQARASMQGMGQGLKGSMPGMPGLGALGGMGGFEQWVAPTLDPDELEKRIEELRTVQFWLEQNARLLGATIQALEVQKMTLSTLRSLNVAMPDLQPLIGVMLPKNADPKGASGPRGKASPGAGSGKKKAAPGASASGAPAGAGLVDPMKWWGALTEQFQSLASQALAAAPGMAVAPAAAAKSAGQGAGAKASAGRASRAKAGPTRPSARRPGR